MLERTVSPEGVVTYVSPLLREIGVPHAFSTRIGGVSPPPFDSLNLGNPNGCHIQDQTARIRENYRLLQRAAGCPDQALTYLHQVHGGVVIALRTGQAHDNDTKGDALASDDPSRAISVRIADCVPVLLASGDGKAVAAVHAGWRGVIAGVAVNALRRMNELSDVPAERVVAAIGPAIGFESFEVGAEVIEEFVRAFGPDAPVRRREDGKGYVNLAEALRLQLTAAGVPAPNLDSTDRCTFRDADEFYSHRRDNGITGRMAAIIAAT